MPEVMNSEGAIYFVGENDILYVDDRRATVYARWSGAVKSFPIGVSRILARPGQRLTAAAAEAARAELAANGEGALFQELIDGRFLIQPTDLLWRPRPPSEPPPEPVASLAIVTADRPAMLARCLRSYASNAQRHGRGVTIHVADDSASATAAETNRSATLDIAATTGCRIVYHGPRDRTRLLDALAAAGVAPMEVLRFGLLQPDRPGWRFGVNRNLVLLSTAGTRTVSVDDDTVCRMLIATTAPATRVRLGSPLAHTHLAFASAEQHSRDATALDDAADFVGLHDTLLGRGLDTLPVTPPAADALEPRLLRALRLGSARILATTTGIVGDPATASRGWYFYLRGRSRACVSGTSDAFSAACSKPYTLRHVESVTVAGVELWMTYCMGLDNRATLPPFFPYRGNEDGLFMVAALACDPGAFTAHIPVAILHEPPVSRSYRPQDLTVALSAVRSCDVLSGLISRASAGGTFRPGGPGVRHLGAQLTEWATDRGGFMDLARSTCCELLATRARHLVSVRADGGGAPEWQTAVERQLAAVEEALLSNALPSVVDRPPMGRPGLDSEGAEGLRADTMAYGTLCRYWPDIVEAARAIMVKRT